MMTGKSIFSLLAAVVLLASCGKSDRATVRGTFSGVNEVPIYLSQVGISTLNRVDTVVTDNKGQFKFKVDLPGNQPAFYNLRCQDQTISLLLSPGEEVEVRSLGNLANNYLVEGSPGSQEIKELNELLFSNRPTLDSLASLYLTLSPSDSLAQQVLTEYNQRFIEQKRGMITFIVSHVNSLSAIYALYQRMPSGDWFFSDPNDVTYFRMVADSLSGRYPQSPNVISLQRDVERMNSNINLQEMLNNAVVSAINFPDLDLPDVNGKRVKLSSLQDQVILIDFWLSTAAESPLNNADLMELYRQYHDRGFEVYQVALDQEKLPWVTAVQQQRLPWISVCDLKGVNSPALRIYNITQLPANVLINREGEIVARNISIEELENRLKGLF
ncbi:MAG: AhpC/TSA family protein [Rikenellaceae bacterium]|jgi:hypothetical protein|nr:AhpC/TSA family protein [Rikenellaceae bacterium]